MNSITLKKILYEINKWLQKKASLINHSEVIKDIYLEVEISAGYFLILTLANLIALGGLITNSAPVIIGAMLISPLMGPILNIGFSFITGDKFVWRKSIKKLTASVALTLIVAAIATYLSPLKDVTNEIIARTRPNLYDLGIAFFAGSAGAVAICTKKNYLTIVPGVAIATAVIPPLSVTGFGIGTGNFNILLGGFFLFFTNFVAIILSTCIVFYLFGFRPSMITEELKQLKRRIIFLAFVLFVISIPLIYTLHKSISEVTLRNNVQNVLEMEFNKEGYSHLSTFNYLKKKDRKLEINAIINTISYMKESAINNAEKNIKDYLKRDIKLYLEQVKVQPGGLAEEVVKPPSPTIAPPKPPSEVIKSSREGVMAVVRQSSDKVEKIISPSTIADFYVGFHDKTFKVSIVLRIKRDKPLSEEEIRWLKRIFATDLNLPVDLEVETAPFVPLLVFKKGETILTDEMKNALMPINDAFIKDNSITVMVEAHPESSVAYNKRIKLSEERAKVVKTVLVEDYKIPESNINVVIHKRKAVKIPTVKVSILMAQGKT